MLSGYVPAQSKIFQHGRQPGYLLRGGQGQIFFKETESSLPPSYRRFNSFLSGAHDSLNDFLMEL